jgi:hypothetical protein
MTFTIKQSDTSPSIQATLQDSNATPINLSGATVRLHMKLLGSSTVLEREVSVVTPFSGIIRYDWQDGDTSVAGTYNAEFEVTYADLSVETFPNTGNIAIVITPELN